MSIVVIGAGYVGLTLALALGEKHPVTLFDVDAEKVERINRRESPLPELSIVVRLKNPLTEMKATCEEKEAFAPGSTFIVAVPTDYDEKAGSFRVEAVESTLEKIERADPHGKVVVKSTVPVGYCLSAKARHKGLSIVFAPEFLREAHAMEDCLSPTRIVLGYEKEDEALAKEFEELQREVTRGQDIPTLRCSLSEAEAIKLFSNTYLAMRVSFFNELDSFALAKGLDPRRLIEGVCLDPRIGDGYNNPSFGYGGYCLPKDTKQMVANYETIPQTLMNAIVTSNATRIEFIAKQIASSVGKGEVVGVYRLAMKKGVSDFRASSVIQVIEALKNQGVNLLIFEPEIAGDSFLGLPLVRDLNELKAKAKIIVANRYDEALSDVKNRLFTRDLFEKD